MKEKKNKGGRPRKADPAAHFYSFRLNSKEKLEFEWLLQRSGLTDISRYIKTVIFGREIKVVKIDKATMDYYIRLTNFYQQYRAIGNNYNQTVKAIKSNFSEKRALAMLYKLEKATIELVVVSKQIIELTCEYEEKWLQK